MAWRRLLRDVRFARNEAAFDENESPMKERVCSAVKVSGRTSSAENPSMRHPCNNSRTSKVGFVRMMSAIPLSIGSMSQQEPADLVC